MNETHEVLKDRKLSYTEAQNEPVPEDFEGQCSGFPERLLGFKGWAFIGEFCRTHDWHYTILRHHHGVWWTSKWQKYREWADRELYRKIKVRLKEKFVIDWLAALIAHAVFLVVRSKIGKMAAMGRL